MVEVEPIGFPEDLIRSDWCSSSAEDVAAMLPPREADTHKRSAGYAVVVGGSRLMTGAVALAGAAAYRAGAGLVAVAVPEGILPVDAGRRPRGGVRRAPGDGRRDRRGRLPLAWTRCSGRRAPSPSAPA